ncbi:hypothetical protein [Glycomyces buryatensis]|uniref:Uncharacterized protein n=1 Tax=Glycomyces buryatensis TaxID=2570927 RepID=A0A4S8QAM4_9ACTN|nr:hypothetical protein [Glycomyces buryatensis]THV41517.1 hypothetical protein FAB82_10410 [Glycomyces buryatensis]
MSTYREALSAQPMEFVNFGTEMAGSASDLLDYKSSYRANVDDLNGHWEDSANDAFNDDAEVVGNHVQQLSGQVTTAAQQITAAGLQLHTDVMSLKSIDAAAHAQGFGVEPAPLVTLGKMHRLAIAMSWPNGAALEASLQAQAAALTSAMQAGLAMVNAADVQAATAMTAAAEALQPLSDKGGTPVEDEAPTGSGDDSSAGGAGAEEEEPTEEETSEAEQESEEQPTDPEGQQQPETPQEPTMPQTPTDPGGYEQPELDDFDDTDNPWANAEPFDPDELGGLASGGSGGGLGAGGGGGLSSGGVPGAGTGSGAGLGGGVPTGMATAPAPVPVGAGRPGGGGAMMGGAGGGRGASGQNDEETSRESRLTEDPDEDVWGINAPDDDPYA